MPYATMERAAPALVRIGISLVLLWFGIQQLMDPNVWTGLIPSWATGISGLRASILVMCNGTFEIVAGVLLIVGLFTRVIAFLSALHLFLITSVVGYNAVGIRDFGLSMSALATFFHGADEWCLERFLKK